MSACYNVIILGPAKVNNVNLFSRLQYFIKLTQSSSFGCLRVFLPEFNQSKKN